MTYRGHIRDGQITLDKPARLPEGAKVNIEVIAEGVVITEPVKPAPLRKFTPIQMPGGPLSEDVIRDRR